MSRFLYCPLCGLPLTEECLELQPPERLPFYQSAYDESLLPWERIAWLGEFRVLGRRDDQMPIDTDVQFDGSLLFSQPSWWEEWAVVRFDYSDLDLAVYDVDTEDGGMFYAPAHDCCLEIAHKIVKSRKRYIGDAVRGSRPNTLLHIYQEILQRAKSLKNKSDINITWDNDYYGARNRWTQPWWTHKGEEWLVANPLEDLSITEFVLAKLQEENSVDERTINFEDKAVSPRSPIELLPVPAVDRLLEHLDLESVLTLRRCSSSMYSALTLTNRFWKDRLLKEETVPWLWDLDFEVLEKVDVNKNWRGLAKSLMAKRTFEDLSLPLGVRNRIRIWKVISEIRVVSD